MNEVRQVALSFLGTGNYQEGTYRLDSHECATRYFPVALKTFFPECQLFVAMTQEAQTMHGQELADACVHHSINIPSGENEAELWEMFDRIADAIPEGTSLIVDVTHGLRSQPIIALSICLYLQTVKSVDVTRILYGAFDKRTEDDIVPVFDLTPFLSLIDWSMAAHQFSEHGHGAPLRDLLTGVHAKTYRLPRDYQAQGLSTMGERLAELGRSFAVVRPNDIIEQSHQVLRATEQTRQDMEHIPEARPFKLILERIEEQAIRFSTDSSLYEEDGFATQAEMIRDYLRTMQFQQATTLAREAMVSKMCVQQNRDPRDRDDREQAEHELNRSARSLRKGTDLAGRDRECAEIWNEIIDLRNDINHAGMGRNPLPTQRAVEQSISLCQRAAEWIEA